MKNIAIIIPTLEGGGAERAVSTISKNLSKEQFNVYLILFDASNIEYEFDGMLINLNLKASNNILIKIFNFIKRIVKIKKIKSEYKIETSISFLPGPNFINVLTRNSDKIILSIRANIRRNDKSIYRKMDNFIIKNVYNKAYKITVVSNGIKKDLVNIFKINENKIEVIHNTYELSEIKSKSVEPMTSNELMMFSNKVIIASGRLEHAKGHQHLIRAFNHIRQFDENIHLIILGEGSLRSYLEQLISDYNLDDVVHMPGFVNNPYKYLKRADVFVLTSISEGFPNSLAEAMACDIPIISADCKTGPREILAPFSDTSVQCSNIEYAENGILIPVCDGKHYSSNDPLTREELILSEAILKVLDNKKLYEKYKFASGHRIKDFKTDKIIKKWERIL